MPSQSFRNSQTLGQFFEQLYVFPPSVGPKDFEFFAGFQLHMTDERFEMLGNFQLLMQTFNIDLAQFVINPGDEV